MLDGWGIIYYRIKYIWDENVYFWKVKNYFYKKLKDEIKKLRNLINRNNILIFGISVK